MSWQALNWCAALHHVKGSRRALLWAMANRHNAKTGLITMGLSSIADESGVARSFAHRQLKTLEREGLVSALIPGSGTRPTAYVIPALASLLEGTQAPVDNSVVERSSVPEVTGSSDLASPLENLASPLEGTPIRIARAPKSNQEENQRAGVAAPDGAAPRSNNGIPPDAATRLATLKADLTAKATADRQAEAKRLRDLLGPPASEPARPVARPVSAAAANAQQAAPDTAAKTPRRTARGRKGHRGREPPATCTRSTTAATRPRRPDDGCRTAQCPARP